MTLRLLKVEDRKFFLEQKNHLKTLKSLLKKIRLILFVLWKRKKKCLIGLY